MKNLIIVTIVSLFMIPAMGLAHGTADANTSFGMMRSLEDRILGEELHEEMENLMVKMMSGQMSEEEAARMVELMEQYPGPQAMMMGRMLALQGPGGETGMQSFGMMDNYNNMMAWGRVGTFGFWLWLVALLSLAWLIVGILAIAWLWQQINRK